MSTSLNASLVLWILVGVAEGELRSSSLNMANIGIFLAMLWPNSFATPNAENSKTRSNVQSMCAKPARLCFLTHVSGVRRAKGENC